MRSLTPDMQIGFVGLGRMGGGMAGRLLAAGHSLVVFDVSQPAIDRLREQGAQAATTLAALAEAVEAVFTSLPLPEDVLACYLGAGGILGAAREGTLLIDVSTIDPTTTRQVADGARARNCSFIASPVGKGPAQAETGDVPLFVGGDDAAVERARPLLEAIGHPLHRLGRPEHASAFKLISNLIGMGNLALLAEGFALGLQAGIDPEPLANALRDTGAGSYQLDLRLPWIMSADFGARFSVDLALKDLRLAVDMAARQRSAVPVGSAALQAFVAAARAGLGDQDVAAVCKLYHEFD